MRDVLLVAAARPNFMKVAPVARAMRDDGRLAPRVVHTGQHYDPLLSDVIMHDLGMPAPEHHLGVGPAAPSVQLGRILEALDAVVEERSPDALVVVGDVTSTLAGALVAANRRIPVAHVEAGLRSFDREMPEERNRVLVDRLSTWLFTTEPVARTNLCAEGIERGIFQAGNVMIDSLLRVLPRARESRAAEQIGLDGDYAVLTLHRPGNVDDPDRLARMLAALEPVAARAPLVFPVHPRTRGRLEAAKLPRGLRCVDPLGYLDFVGLVAGATLVLTDSGGLQEETTVLGVPCITLRPNTERPITIDVGTNERVDVDEAPERIGELGLRALGGHWKSGSVPDDWDGRAAERLVAHLADELG